MKIPKFYIVVPEGANFPRGYWFVRWEFLPQMRKIACWAPFALPIRAWDKFKWSCMEWAKPVTLAERNDQLAATVDKLLEEREEREAYYEPFMQELYALRRENRELKQDQSLARWTHGTD